ncbi:ubiquinone/menaquinone biosynthesis C-methylase UbiE [Litoreibacter ponti]|uniref:Ubiquinone/menaquinone biosynthesis C-methylase UbiE n=1 Tax=Litoreibacter ponti TaxID=1510457 RepID=A0A2T6BKV4_9RHOB|nr:class I SAM-dependent methyltransferase [Litoreibacter ponti]PTX56677.1 ubiquinone/menaquinone biosynthesis C-methylase UbiE [Litoreibacter ponti]
MTAMTFWDRVAPKYARSKIKDLDNYHRSLERTRSYLKPTDRVLELGCGTGSTALLLADNVAEYVGTDISGAMIDIARAKPDAPDGLRFVQASADAAIEGAPFDVVMGLNLYHLVEDLDGALRHAHTLTKPGGLFISKTVCLWQKRWFVGPLVKIMQLMGKAPFVHLLKQSDLETRIEAAGFEIIETGNYPAISRYVVARRS